MDYSDLYFISKNIAESLYSFDDDKLNLWFISHGGFLLGLFLGFKSYICLQFPQFQEICMLISLNTMRIQSGVNGNTLVSYDGYNCQCGIACEICKHFISNV